MSSQAMDLKVVALDRVYHSVSRDRLTQWASEGRISQNDLVCPTGTNAWQPVTEVPWLAASLPRGLLDATATAVATEPTPEMGADAAAGWRVRRPRSRTEDVQMDMMPMIDVTFQLLIFFMLTNAMVNPSPVAAPEAVHGRGVTPDGKQVILVDEQGRYFLGENTREENVSPSLAALVQEVRANAASLEEPMDVIITAHKTSKHVHLRQLVEELGNVPGVGQVMLGVEEKRQ